MKGKNKDHRLEGICHRWQFLDPWQRFKVANFVRMLYFERRIVELVQRWRQSDADTNA